MRLATRQRDEFRRTADQRKRRETKDRQRLANVEDPPIRLKGKPAAPASVPRAERSIERGVATVEAERSKQQAQERIQERFKASERGRTIERKTRVEIGNRQERGQNPEAVGLVEHTQKLERRNNAEAGNESQQSRQTAPRDEMSEREQAADRIKEARIPPENVDLTEPRRPTRSKPTSPVTESTLAEKTDAAKIQVIQQTDLTRVKANGNEKQVTCSHYSHYSQSPNRHQAAGSSED